MMLRRLLQNGLVVALLAGCGVESGEKAAWSLVGVYDAASLGIFGQPPAEDYGQYVWVQSPGMRSSCGPGKAADGLGVYEGEAMANALTPVLAILLKRTGEGNEPLTPAGVRVGLGEGSPSYSLKPGVMPRYVSAHIEGDGLLRYRQQVRTQLEMELCLEHKTGRGWIGGTAHQLRQAFLLDPQDEGGTDRRYYGGQRDPVPALLGPPDACLVRGKDQPNARKAGRGEGSLDLVPSDVWGASLRDCEIDEVGGSRVVGINPVDIALGKTIEEPKRSRPRFWTDLVVTIHPAEKDLDVLFDLKWGDEFLFKTHNLFAVPEGGGNPGTTDLLGRVPYTYPLVGTIKDPNRYSLLLVPNWQVVEGLWRLDEKRRQQSHGRGNPGEPRTTSGQGIQDGVGWLMAHPEHLFVQVPLKAGVEKTDWLNLAEPLAGGPGKVLAWGYIPGMLTGREPIAVLGAKVPTWNQTMTGHRAAQHGMFLIMLMATIGFFVAGFVRLRDLWANIPEERIVFWPGTAAGDEDEEDVPDVPEGEGE
ncbi:MAG: hypothetical protein HN348_03535 [Proteobacteria bacterium]|nr:hypothetical protein [Pseudomonadota bacterium]